MMLYAVRGDGKLYTTHANSATEAESIVWESLGAINVRLEAVPFYQVKPAELNAAPYATGRGLRP